MIGGIFLSVVSLMFKRVLSVISGLLFSVSLAIPLAGYASKNLQAACRRRWFLLRQ